MTRTRPTQAVILAGGQGTRLRPITDTIPKPLIEFHNRPFLSYLLEQVKSQGIKEVLLLIGYLSTQIRDYCGDGSVWGLNIKYVESPLEAETGQRLWDASPFIEPHFLLMYCDNYWPMNLDQMWSEYATSSAMGMITSYANQDNYTRSNLRIAHNGLVEIYDRNRTQSGLNGVDIGYAILSKKVLELLPNGNPRFEHEVYPQLSSQGLLRAHATHHRYYSVGSHERLPLTESFLLPQKAVLLDRDGVLNIRPPQAHYVRSWDEFHWLPGVFESLRNLQDYGYKLLLCSNQSGIARGVMTEDNLAQIHQHMNSDLVDEGIRLDAIYYCPHGWDDGCFCRKPSPGMMFQAQREFHLDLSKTMFIGDDIRDQQAGQAAGCLTDLVTAERPLLAIVEELLSKEVTIKP